MNICECTVNSIFDGKDEEPLLATRVLCYAELYIAPPPSQPQGGLMYTIKVYPGYYSTVVDLHQGASGNVVDHLAKGQWLGSRSALAHHLQKTQTQNMYGGLLHIVYLLMR